MRAFLPDYQLRKAATLDEAVGLLASEPGVWRALAGGTDVMVQLGAGTLSNRQHVSIWGIRELRRIDVDREAVTLGALTTFSDILRHETLRRDFPLLGRAAADTGGIANQNRGTIAGNIANASPAADTPPPLLVYDAQLELTSVRGRRIVPYERFHTAYKQMDLAPDELITAVRLPRRHGWHQHYRKVGARRAQAISKVCFAGAALLEAGRIADIRLAFGSVAPTVVRAFDTEAMLRGARVDDGSVDRAGAALLAELRPIDDVRSTAAYRRQVAVNVLAEFLQSLSR
ncbi:MAG TPA: xanthine dehydrogenase family protein subunit M [Vicinamibacterales bacterium]|nr:xanthine dehydrogenase family protein subunit M [Vicinamibacterales bacterium]